MAKKNIERIAVRNGFGSFISGRVNNQTAAETAAIAMKACIGALWYDCDDDCNVIFKTCEKLGFY